MKISILHLSDIHFKAENNPIIEKQDRLFDAFKNKIIDSKCLFIVVTGDIAFSGRPEEYNHASSFLGFLKESVLHYNSNCNVHFVLIPGNHDCDFQDENSARDIIISEIIKNPQKIDQNIIDICTTPQANFFEFSKSLHNTKYIDDDICDKLMSRFEFPIGSYKISFNAFNLSWTSKKNERQSELVFPAEKILNLPSVSNSNIAISLIHHPLHWLNHKNIQSFKNNLEAVSNIILSGHEHTSSGTITRKIGGTNPKEYLEGGVLQDSKSKHNSAFSLISFDIEKRCQQIVDFTWNKSDKMYLPKSIDNECDFILGENGLLHLDSDYQNKINAPIMRFVHPRLDDLKLTDIFVFQDLKRIRENETNLRLNAKRIIDTPGGINQKILIFGEDSSGKTSLGYMLQMYLNNLGRIPLIIEGKKIRKADATQLTKIIDSTVFEQYGKIDLNKFHQSDKNQITIIIDGFEQSQLNSAYKSQAIDIINQNFDNIIVFAHSSLELETLSDKNLNNSFSKYDLFRITEFGHVLRDKLIEKWILLGQHETIQQAELHETKIEISKTINVAIGNNFIPRYPIYIVTLLQAFETNSTASLQGSSYGHYYHYLIVQALSKTKVKQEDYDFYFSFLSHLAHFCFTENNYLINDGEMDSFYEKFRKYTLVPENKAHNLSILLKSNLLTYENGTYSFGHNYIYYYFVSKYLADYIDDDEIKNLIEKITKRLYRTEFANIIVFLIHHSKKEFIIENILVEAREIFSSLTPISFQEDEIANLNKLIDGDLKFALEERSPQQARENKLRDKDKYETKHPVKSDREEAKFDENVPSLNLFERINLSRKMMEILGQIAKNYYGSLKGETKYNLIDETIRLGMRTLKSFVNDMDRHKDVLIDNIKYVIDKKSILEPHRREYLCNRILFNFASLVSYSFVKKTSKSISSRNLGPICDSICENDKQISTKLITIGSQLSFPGGINGKEIKEFYSEIYGNKLAESILKMIVMNHLYMFEVPISIRQQLCSHLDIEQEKKNARFYNKGEKF